MHKGLWYNLHQPEFVLFVRERYSPGPHQHAILFPVQKTYAQHR